MILSDSDSDLIYLHLTAESFIASFIAWDWD